MRYTPEVIKFMRKCAIEKLTPSEALKKTEEKFGCLIFSSTFRTMAKSNNIIFFHSYLKEGNIDIFKDKKFLKFMKLKKNQKLKLYQLRDRIIEEFGGDEKLKLDFKPNHLRSFCRRNGVKIKEVKKKKLEDE